MNDSCRICGTQTRSFLHQRTKTAYYHCPNCGFIKKDEACFPDRDQEIQIYLRHENSLERADYVAFLKGFVDEALIPFVGNGKKGLDFGSGPTPVLSQILIRDYGFDVDIYDYYFAPEKIYQGKTYDFVITSEVIEHIREPKEVFDLFAKLLPPGGVLAIMTLFHPQSDDDFQTWWYTRDKSHISFFVPETFRYLAKNYGFRIVRSDGLRQITFVKI